MPCVPNARRRCEAKQQPESRHQSLDPEGSLCHRAKDAGGPRHDEPRGTHGRRVRPPPARDGRRGQGAPWRRPQDSVEPAVVRSAFDLPAAQRAAIENAVKETFAADVHVQFETAPELVSGIELSTNGQKVAWSIADYLATLEKSAGELLNEKDKSEAKTERKPQEKAEPKPKPEPKAAPKAKTASKPEEPKPEGEAPLNTEPDSLQTIFDHAFAGISQTLEASRRN